MNERITLSELQDKLIDLTLDKRVLRRYFLVDEDNSRAFHPALKLNLDLVDTEGLEGDIAIEALNWVSRRYRQYRYHRRIEENPGLIRIVSEGDSWFQYPVKLLDVIDHLFNDYAIYSLGGAGDCLENMLDDDEFMAMERVHPPVFMISGGGNDLLGSGRLTKYLHPFDSNRKPEDYPNEDFERALNKLGDIYRQLAKKLLDHFPDLIILCHGYDRPIPNNGVWLGRPMGRLGIQEKTLQRKIMAVIIDQFNHLLHAFSHEFRGSVIFVDCRGAVPDDQWFDELHPTDQGFGLVAQRFRSVIDGVIRPERL